MVAASALSLDLRGAGHQGSERSSAPRCHRRDRRNPLRCRRACSWRAAAPSAAGYRSLYTRGTRWSRAWEHTPPAAPTDCRGASRPHLHRGGLHPTRVDCRPPAHQARQYSRACRCNRSFVGRVYRRWNDAARDTRAPAEWARPRETGRSARDVCIDGAVN